MIASCPRDYLIAIIKPDDASIFGSNLDPSLDPLRLGPHQIDTEQAMRQFRTHNLHTLDQKESTLELTGRNATMQVMAFLGLFRLPAMDNQLVLFQHDINLLTLETGHRQGDSQPFGGTVFFGKPLDILGGITVSGGFGNAIQNAFNFVKSK